MSFKYCLWKYWYSSCIFSSVDTKINITIMVKKMKKLSLLILSVVVLVSCSKKEKHEVESGDWKELNAFHRIMAAAYHPLKDSGNLAPTRKLINQLADEAEKWSGAALPDKVDTPEVKEKLQKLKTDARALANEIHDGASDEIVKNRMIKLHDQFHAVMEAWNHDEDDEDEEDH